MFRFENLEIWKRTIQITNEIFDITDSIGSKHHYRFADQLQGAVLSISNNIAEGSGSSSKRDFDNFLNYTHRSVFETVNMLIIACHRSFITQSQMKKLKNEFEEISKMIPGLSKSLKTKTSNSKLNVPNSQL